MNKKKNLNNNKMDEELINLKKKLMNLNFQKYSGQLEKTSQIRITKKQIAKLKTKFSNQKGDNNA
tara:strand:+ start:396 stop:590 length:195 start_codon:yes stop_codon:yes gene_type:complete